MRYRANHCVIRRVYVYMRCRVSRRCVSHVPRPNSGASEIPKVNRPNRWPLKGFTFLLERQLRHADRVRLRKTRRDEEFSPKVFSSLRAGDTTFRRFLALLLLPLFSAFFFFLRNPSLPDDASSPVGTPTASTFPQI